MIKSRPIAIGRFSVNGKIIHADTHAQAVRKYRNRYRLEIAAISVIMIGLVVSATLCIYYISKL